MADDDVIRKAIRFLLDGHEKDAASLLLSCDVYLDYQYGSRDNQTADIDCIVKITAPRRAYDLLNGKERPANIAIQRAFDAVLNDDTEPREYFSVYIAVYYKSDDNFGSDWRTEAWNEIKDRNSLYNQAAYNWSSKIVTWENLRFRSNTEIKIAIALDRAGTLFLPNTLTRLGKSTERKVEEADFLVCYQGKWGVLEVDGPHHTPEKAAKDHDKDSRFQHHGIKFVRRYDAEKCYSDPEGVVKDFLENLLRMYQ